MMFPGRPVLFAASQDGAGRPGITEDVIAVINNKAKLLNRSRKKRRAPEDLADEAALGGFKVRDVFQ